MSDPVKRIYKLDESGKLVDITDEMQRTPYSMSPNIWNDIAPYEFMGESHRGNHEIITSRSRHREALKEGGYIEVGNEQQKALRG